MNQPIRSILSLIAVLAIALIVPLAFAQAPEPAVAPATEEAVNPEAAGFINGALNMVVNSFAGQNGWVAKVFSILATISGFCALTIKPLWDKFVFPGITAYVQATASKDDDAWLQRMLENKIVKAFLWALNLVAHIKIPIIDKDGAAVSPSSAGTTLPATPLAK